MIAIPGYLDKDAWEGFCDMRKAIKKPLTVRAAKLIVYELQRIKDAGHDPNAALDQSTNHCWADVYVPKDKEIERKPVSREQAERDMKAAEEKRVADYIARTSAKQEAKPPIRRVA